MKIVIEAKVTNDKESRPLNEEELRNFIRWLEECTGTGEAQHFSRDIAPELKTEHDNAADYWYIDWTALIETTGLVFDRHEK